MSRSVPAKASTNGVNSGFAYLRRSLAHQNEGLWKSRLSKLDRQARNESRKEYAAMVARQLHDASADSEPARRPMKIGRRRLSDISTR